ncbi:MAG: ABC transporter substrate-binding protein [Candidatus Vogelbacteria bacterium]|nr:ABC transporter substrate-binding protein [Candidatus Vogelbacteria bacterium]
MNSTVKVILGIVVVILVIWGLTSWSGKPAEAPGPAGSPVSTEPIKIGFIGPLTGDAANIGQNAKAAVEIAVAEVNAAGGINGRPLNVIYEDGQCSGTEAANAANKLINIDKVPVILGGACSGETSSFTGLAEQTKTAVLSYCSSAPSITNAGDYIFRNYPSDTFQGAFAAQYIREGLKKSKVAVLYAKSDWGTGIKDVFVQEFKKLGGTVLAEEGYEQTARDLRTNLTKIKSANPEALYFLGYTEASIPGLKQASELKLAVPIFGGDAWDDSKIWTEVGSAGEGAMYSVVSANQSEAFKASMRGKIGNDEIAVCSPTAYDAVKLLSVVLATAGPDGTAIKDELYKTVYRGGVSSSEIRFDQNGDLVGANYIVKVVKNSKAEELK